MESQPKQKRGTGQLFVVATPIGNLGDMSFRAVETLKQADLIAAEDTRTSGRLLAHFGIDTPMFSYHEHNEAKAAKRLLERLQAGKNVALITDAGTPLISDPGYRLVHLLREEGVDIVPIPGACSPIAALSASGLPSDRFQFLGFLPRSGGGRRELLKEIGAAKQTSILLESPRRLLKTLQTLEEFCPPPREICVARELTKLHEEFVCGTASDAVARFEAEAPRGEIVIVIGPAADADEASDETIATLLAEPEYAALSPSARAKAVAKRLGVSRSRVYELQLAESRETAGEQR